MARKQQEQSSVKSGDVLLLYEDSYGGYVYSDITPRLPDFACVCFYPVKPPYSKDNPGLPDVNCATFSVQLVNEKKSASGTPVHYGQSIKLRHTGTGRFLAVSKTTTARCEPNLRVELLEITGSGDTVDDCCKFRILPLHSDHALGNQVRFNQPVKFESVGVPGHFLHCSSECYCKNLWVVPDRHELNVSSSTSSLLMILHRAISSTETLGCRAGKLLKLSETKESFSIIAKGFWFRNPLAFNSKPVLDFPDIKDDCRKHPWDPEDVCAQNKYTDPGKTWFPASLWQFEEEKNPTSGELIKFNNHYRIKHVLTKKYLALVTRCGHDLNTCPEVLCWEAFKVVLKDRSLAQKSDQEEHVYDDTLFTPISPDEQTSTHTVSEGTQLLLRHKRTGMWLNVSHDTVFQWHEVRKRKGFNLYDLQPYYEVDADKRMLTAAKDPHHAFSVHQSCVKLEALYDIAGVLPVLTKHIRETRQVSALELEPLKQLFMEKSLSEYHAFIAQFGVIELLLALTGDQLKLAFEFMKQFARKASVYEKNRLITVIGTVKEVSVYMKMICGMEVNAELSHDNMCAWAQGAESRIKDFLTHVSENKVVLEILGRMCTNSGKPVGMVQDAIVNYLIKDSKHRKMLFKMKINEGNEVVVYRESAESSELPLSTIKGQELESLHYQLILFSRLCQGSNSLAVKEIDKKYAQDAGFISFEEALECMKNRGQAIPLKIQADCIHLSRVLFAETLERNPDALEPPTWCFEDKKETRGASTLHVTESDRVNEMRFWIQDFPTYSDIKQDTKTIMLEQVKLLDVLVRKGYYTDVEMVEASFTKVLEILRLISCMTGLIPLFFHLQMRQKVQGFRTTMQEGSEDVKQLMLQQTTLDAIKRRHDEVPHDKVPYDLIVCYFTWMNLHHGLHPEAEGAEGAAHEAQWLTTDESKRVLHHALQNYSRLRQCLKCFSKCNRSSEVKEILKEFAGRCICKGIPCRRNQLIYSSIVLDDILSYIFDPTTSFPMWCWCKICLQGAIDFDVANSPSVIECFHFLRALAYNNFRVQKRLVQHLDDILPYCEVYPEEVAQLLVEIFASEPAVHPSDVFQKVENIHLQICEGQIKILLQFATRKVKKKMPGLPLLKALPFIATYEEVDLPITRNQEYIMKNLVVNKSILSNAGELLLQCVQNQHLSEEWLTKVEYLLSMTNLLAACAEGKSLSIDAQCQSIYHLHELLYILCNCEIPSEMKTPFLRFLISVYMDCNGSVRVGDSIPFVWRQVWQYLETVVTFLLGMAKYLEKELKRKPINDVHVQEVLMNKLRPFGIPNADIGVADGTADFARALHYLVKGVLPMLIELYGPVFQSNSSPLTPEQISITQGIFNSLLLLGEWLPKVFVSPIHLKMYHVSVAAVLNGLPRDKIPPYVKADEIFGRASGPLPAIASKVKRKYDEDYYVEDYESHRFKHNLKEVLQWNEQDAFRKLLDVFQGEDGAQKCTDALGRVLTWLYNEAPLQDWPIFPAIPGLVSRCLKALQIHVMDLKKRDTQLQDVQEKGHFILFCEWFLSDKRHHLEEVLRLASVSNMEELAEEALNFLKILLDSHDNPIRKLLAECVHDTETYFSPLSSFLHAVHRCIQDSITSSKARIDVRNEIEERRGIANSVSKGFQEETDSDTDSTQPISPVVNLDDGETIPLVKFTRPSLASTLERSEARLSLRIQPDWSQMPAQQQVSAPPLGRYKVEDLIPRLKKLKTMLSIIGLMCDEQNQPLQAHLRKQPGRFDSVNIVGDVVELLHHIHAMHVNPQLSQSAKLTEEVMEIINLILQALIEFCAGNYENQEVVVNRQISGDITWILSAETKDRQCELSCLKAQAVELLETLMEEVAEESKGVVEKLRDDEKLQNSLEMVTEEFHAHIELVHVIPRSGWKAFFKELCLFLASLCKLNTGPTNEESENCKQKVQQSRFRAYHFGITLRSKTPASDVVKGTEADTDDVLSIEGKEFCERHSKSIEVFYKHEKEAEPIHTSIAFPYHPDDELREEIKEKIKWKIDRSSPEDKLLDLVRYAKAAKKDIEHQKRLREGLLTKLIGLSSGIRHYMLLLLTFFLNLVVLFTFVVPADQIPPAEVTFPSRIPIENNSIAISPETPLWSDVVLYVVGAIHLFLSLWMVIEYHALNWPHFVNKRWWSAIIPRFIRKIVFDIWKSTEHGWKNHKLRPYLEPPEKQKLKASIYGWDSTYRLVFLLCSAISLVPAWQGYFYCICLLYIIEESDVLRRVLQAVTKNGKSLLWVAALGIMVLFIYAVISFAFLHESFFVENPEFPLFCESLGQCFVSVMRYGLLDNIGLIVPLVSGGFQEAGWRLLYDISFFIIVSTIGLNIIFGIIVDTFSELRIKRATSEKDMDERCFICSIPNYDFDRQNPDGFKHHVAGGHNMWNYICFYVYVSRVEVRDRTAIQAYVYQAFENRSIDFFPRKCALDLIDREIEATTDDLLKQVKTATHAVKTTTHDLAQDITDQAQGASEVVVTRLSKKISRGFEDISEKGGVEAKLQKMNDEIESLKSGIKEQLAQVHGVQQDLSNQIAALRTSILERLPLKDPASK